jgi:hypothetical protein
VVLRFVRFELVILNNKPKTWPIKLHFSKYICSSSIINGDGKLEIGSGCAIRLGFASNRQSAWVQQRTLFHSLTKTRKFNDGQALKRWLNNRIFQPESPFKFVMFHVCMFPKFFARTIYWMKTFNENFQCWFEIHARVSLQINNGELPSSNGYFVADQSVKHKYCPSLIFTGNGF